MLTKIWIIKKANLSLPMLTYNNWLLAVVDLPALKQTVNPFFSTFQITIFYEISFHHCTVFNS
jgi:hypothetical protein